MGGIDKDKFEVEGTISGHINNEHAFAATSHVNVRTPVCPRCGSYSTVTVPEAGYREWLAGKHVQRAFPDMSAGDRELLLTGYHPYCWDKDMGATAVEYDYEEIDSEEDSYEDKHLD